MVFVAFIVMVIAFATFVTSHVVLAIKLTASQPRWKGPVALFVPPLAPLWGWQAGRRISVILWAAAILLYAAARVVIAFAQWS